MTVPSGRPSAPTRALSTLLRAGGPGLAVAQRVERLRATGMRGARRGAGQPPADDTATLARQDADAYRRIWEGAAAAVGAEVEEIGEGFLSVRRGDAETVVKRNLVMLDHPVSIALALDKAVMHRLLGEAGIPVPDHVVARRSQVSVAADWLAGEQKADVPGRFVVKPASDTGGGYGVTCGVETTDDLWRAWLWAAAWNERLVVERQVDGEEYRLLFLDGELLDAVHRSLPTMVGDGRSTVAELIAAENRRRLGAGPGEVGRVVRRDLDCRLALRRAGVTPRSVVPEGVRVPVKGNVGENSAVENVTDHDLSPEIVGEAARAAQLARLRFAGVDVVTPDPGRSLAAAGGVVLEVNGTPGLQHHYLVRHPAGATPVASVVLETMLVEAVPAKR